jgi:hypothetical protein
MSVTLQRAEPGPRGGRATTLCTFVADLTAGEAIIAARDDDPVAIPLPDLAQGNPGAVRPTSLGAGRAGA